MPECQLVHQSERRTTKDRNLAAGLQRTTSAQFVQLLAAGRVCTDSSGDEGMSKASTELLEQGTQTPSPAPDLIPAQTENQPRTHIGIGTANGGASKGALLQAAADLKNSEANRAAARANLEKAKSALVQTKADYDRAVGLTKDGVMSKQQLDLAQSNYEAAKASVDAAEANITQAEAQISLKEAAVTVAQTNLDYTVIRSPIDGTVVARNVDVGQTVAASLQAPTIITLAQDLTKMVIYPQVYECHV